MTRRYIQTISCPDRVGVVATISSFFAARGANITESQHFLDPPTNRSYMRTVFTEPARGAAELATLDREFEPIARGFGMQCRFHDAEHRLRVLVAVSKQGHCLNSLLSRWHAGTLPIQVVGVVSNHDDQRRLVEWYGVPYHHLPIEGDGKAAQEQRLLSLFDELRGELLVLARYMQILAGEMCGRLSGRAINIHHSFLPGFKGGRPYHQAYERGVKLIGATAHSLSAVDHPENQPGTVSLKDVRLGYQKSGFLEGLHPWVEENLEQTLITLSRAGATLVEIKELPMATSSEVAGEILMAEFPGNVARYFNRHRAYDRSVFGLIHELHVDGLKKSNLRYLSQSVTGEGYIELAARLLEARGLYRRLMSESRIDALLYPTSKVPNTPNDGAETFVSKGPRGEQIAEYLYGANMPFAPAMKTPSVALFSGMDRAGLPLSMTLDGYTGQDRRLLDIAEAMEKVLPPLAEPTAI